MMGKDDLICTDNNSKSEALRSVGVQVPPSAPLKTLPFRDWECFFIFKKT